MQFRVKLRDVRPGNVFTTHVLDATGVEADLWEHVLRPVVKIPESAWLVNVELRITAECIVKPTGDNGASADDEKGGAS